MGKGEKSQAKEAQEDRGVKVCGDSSSGGRSR